jgi:hypothetical protein
MTVVIVFLLILNRAIMLMKSSISEVGVNLSLGIKNFIRSLFYDMANNVRKIEWMSIQKPNSNKIHGSVSTSQYSIVFYRIG